MDNYEFEGAMFSASDEGLYDPEAILIGIEDQLDTDEDFLLVGASSVQELTLTVQNRG